MWFREREEEMGVVQGEGRGNGCSSGRGKRKWVWFREREEEMGVVQGEGRGNGCGSACLQGYEHCGVYVSNMCIEPMATELQSSLDIRGTSNVSRDHIMFLGTL